MAKTIAYDFDTLHVKWRDKKLRDGDLFIYLECDIRKPFFVVEILIKTGFTGGFTVEKQVSVKQGG
jgi:hypothetical protein